MLMWVKETLFCPAHLKRHLFQANSSAVLPDHNECKGKWWDSVARLAEDDRSNHSFSFPAVNSATFVMVITLCTKATLKRKVMSFSINCRTAMIEYDLLDWITLVIHKRFGSTSLWSKTGASIGNGSMKWGKEPNKTSSTEAFKNQSLMSAENMSNLSFFLSFYSTRQKYHWY